MQRTEVDAAITGDGAAVQGDGGSAAVGVAQGMAVGQRQRRQSSSQLRLACFGEAEPDALAAGQPRFVDASITIDRDQAQTGEVSCHTGLPGGGAGGANDLELGCHHI